MNYLEKQAIRHYDADSLIFREGDQGTSMFIIQSGQVKIWTLNSNQEMNLAVLKRGNIFGEMALIDQGLRSANASAEGETVCLEISQMLFQKGLNTIPKWMRSFFKILVERLRLANSKSNTVTEKDISRQVVLMIDNCFKELTPNRLGETSKPWKPLVSEIALMLQLADEIVDKVLHKIVLSHLASSKITEQRQRLFVLKEKDKFQNYAKFCLAQLKENRGAETPQEYRKKSAKLMELAKYFQIVLSEQAWLPDIESQFLDSRFRELYKTGLDQYKEELRALKAEGIFESKQNSDGDVMYTVRKDALTNLIQSQKTIEDFEEI